ncbi:P-loop containing nucleoside triphosphate hydrolase protein [Lipomyces chichibuensis]|uniref:P-loop containing nucleoside triphosphate hydrolase protein n=1 Tax=Lipomyces chichibuensis TaxID=1546026 RepID=UPI003343D034
MDYSTSIQVSCRQTRFDIKEDAAIKDIDVNGLNISIVSTTPTASSSESDVSSKSKLTKSSKSAAIEILGQAELKLKCGHRYGLIGRNGTGKSTLLRAISERLIPGMLQSLKIAFLDQTISLSNIDNIGSASATVLQYVLESDKYRNELLSQYNLLSHALNDTTDSLSVVRVMRQVRHDRLLKEFSYVEKMARLRSGARGLQARKELVAMEKKVSESSALLLAKPSSSTLQQDSQEAVDILSLLQSELDMMQATDLEAKARTVLSGLGFSEERIKSSVRTLSGGWQMRLLLAAALVKVSDGLILDEPTNYLDLLGIIWLQKYIESVNSDTTVVIVSHDRSFVNAVCDETIILSEKSLKYFRGTLDEYEEDFRSKRLYLLRMKEAQDKQIEHMQKTIQNNLKLGKKTGDDNRLRQAKSRQKKLDDRMGMQVNAKGGRFRLSKDMPGWHDNMRAHIDVPEEEREMHLKFPSASELRFPGPLVSMEKVSFRYSRTTEEVLHDIDLVVHLGDRVGIVGLNGCGKSTLLKLITGMTTPTKGAITKHPRLKMGYYSQHSVEKLQELGKFDLSVTALSLLLEKSGGSLSEQECRGILAMLGIAGNTVSAVPIAKLSGGQLVRLAFALVLWERPHLMVLDEVTTHLDFYTVNALSEALAAYSGALIIVSHDRYLVRRVIEGTASDDAEEDEDDHDDLTVLSGKRTVYRLVNGTLKVQKDGMNQFEKAMEKKCMSITV